MDTLTPAAVMGDLINLTQKSPKYLLSLDIDSLMEESEEDVYINAICSTHYQDNNQWLNVSEFIVIAMSLKDYDEWRADSKGLPDSYTIVEERHPNEYVRIDGSEDIMALLANPEDSSYAIKSGDEIWTAFFDNYFPFGISDKIYADLTAWKQDNLEYSFEYF